MSMFVVVETSDDSFPTALRQEIFNTLDEAKAAAEQAAENTIIMNEGDPEDFDLKWVENESHNGSKQWHLPLRNEYYDTFSVLELLPF